MAQPQLEQRRRDRVTRPRARASYFEDAAHMDVRVTLKPGGVAMFILPDMCDRERDGDHFRLATEASHFVEEYREHKSASNRKEAIMSICARRR